MFVNLARPLQLLGATLALICAAACGEVIRDPDRAVASSTTTDGEVIRDPDRVAMASSSEDEMVRD